MNQITLRHVCKRYENGMTAVKDFSLDIEEGEFVILVGPSGCGKSTTLRMIAGLEDISSGELWMNGQLVNFLEPQKRDLSMVFQNYALYPHMTIYDNMAFSLQIRKVPKAEIDRRVREAARILDIEDLLKRRPSEVSGGQRQRVAIGSAIVRKPSAYLMDEPLSNLDAKLRSQMRVELAKLHHHLKATMIYVTHDQVEAMTLGTRIVVMNKGEIQQASTPVELYRNPINRFVAGFIGSPSMNFLNAGIIREHDHIWLDIQGQRVKLPDELKAELEQQGFQKNRVVLGVRPEDLHPEMVAAAGTLHAEKAAAADKEAALPDRLTMNIEISELLGSEVQLHGMIGSTPVSVRTAAGCELKSGEQAVLRVDFDHALLFDEDTEQNLLYALKHSAYLATHETAAQAKDSDAEQSAAFEHAAAAAGCGEAPAKVQSEGSARA